MGWVRVDIDVHGAKEASRYFEIYAEEAGDLSEPLREAGERLIDAIEQQLDTEGAAGLGRRWTPLDPGYQAWKLAHGLGRRILERTGAMRTMLLDKTTALRVGRHRAVYAPQFPVYASRSTAGAQVLVSLSEVAGFHQTGTRHMPQRKIVALSNAQRHYIIDQAFAAWLNSLRRRPLWTTPPGRMP